MKALAKSGGLFSSGCSGSTAGIAQAIIDAADQGAAVISMSIGGGVVHRDAQRRQLRVQARA